MIKLTRWSDEKLERELAFAERCSDDGIPETIAWRDALLDEANRRNLFARWDREA